MSSPEPQKHEIGNRTYFVADVEPLDADGMRTTIVGTSLWVITLLGLLPFRAQLAEAGLDWILWTCFAGIGLGLWGFDYCRRRRAKRLASQSPAGRRRAMTEADS